MAILICVIIVCGAFVLIMDHSDKKEREALERKESAEFGLERSEYQFQKIFESSENFINEFLSWLTGRCVSSTDDSEELVSVKTGGLKRVSISSDHGERVISIFGLYSSPDDEYALDLQILVFPNSIVDKSIRNNPYVVVAGDLSEVFDDKFFAESRGFYEVQKETLVMKGFVPALTVVSALYNTSSCKKYYVTLCQEIERVARDLESQLASKGFLPWERFLKRQT